MREFDLEQPKESLKNNGKNEGILTEITATENKETIIKGI